MAVRKCRLAGSSSSSRTRTFAGVEDTPPPLLGKSAMIRQLDAGRDPCVTADDAYLEWKWPLFQGGLEAAEELRKPVDERNGAEPLPVVDRWIAADDLARLDVTWNTALRSSDYTVADGAMSGNADLACENYAFADHGGAGESNLSAQK